MPRQKLSWDRWAATVVTTLTAACSADDPVRGEAFTPDAGSRGPRPGTSEDGSRSVHAPPEPHEDDESAAETCELPLESRRVFFGTLEPTYVMLSAGQQAAIGALMGGGAVCTGTLVAGNWVLTARHCTRRVEPEELAFHVGQDITELDNPYPAVEFVTGSRFDTALVRLARSPLDDDPAIVPIAVNGETLQPYLGDTFEGAGFGATEFGGLGVRYFSAEPLVHLEGEHAFLDGEGRRGFCGGDSGGPLLGLFGAETRVAGTLEGGEGSCVGVDFFVRTDVQIDWIADAIGPTTCDAVSDAGVCDGNVALRCQGGQVTTERCDQQEICAQDPASGVLGCVPDPSCGELTPEGVCDAQTARWCEDDERREQRCAVTEVCTFSDSAGGNRCLPRGCDDVPPGGECVGTNAWVCREGFPFRLNCADCDMTCAMQGGRPECVPQ